MPDKPDSLDTSAPRVYTVRQFSQRHPAFPTGALRDLIFKSSDRITSRGVRIEGNSLEASGALIRLGRKILIREEFFFKWLVEQQHRRTAGARAAEGAK